MVRVDEPYNFRPLEPASNAGAGAAAAPTAFCTRLDAEARRNAWRQTFIDLLAAILRGRRLNSRIALRATAEGGKSYAFVLDFNLLPRLAPPKKSMQESDLIPLGRSPSNRQMIPPNTGGA
jgi:hypothetical protein